ncbi:hypothetical protein [Streptomyces avidinii]|uniref:Nucleotidyltransferase AbiEii toxin of type IV toxin-antitoxin system n=1 Tax=Streptomyces avidinii TaxID=1895 RepID=A0ABS4KW45_STRAV|nr:hypothetical protein [Streptomyces avidinii]MBP2034244.1 hypothetical protein [Streptomyces avidinii]GGZ35216.1 hypothetical protein GCM10010343_73110 [Streptomyces avidinii]
MTLEYLLVDDQGKRSRVFDRQVSIPGELAFTMVDDPELLLDLSPADLAEFDGAIVDFHLNTSTAPDYHPLTIDDPRLFGGPVEVRTGMGVMLHLKRHVPDMTLYGMTELTHAHAKLFLAAASVWLGAEPLNANEPPEILRRVLLTPDGERADLQASHRQMSASAEPFRRLMDACLNRQSLAETYDWLRCYRLCNGPRAHKQVAGVVRRLMGIRVGADPEKTFFPMMTRWQTHLAAFAQSWGEDTTDWPDLSAGVSAKTWADRNPVLDYVKPGAYDTFFNSPDVRAALTYHRSTDPGDDPQ